MSGDLVVRQSSGRRVWIVVTRRGVLATGLDPGDFTVTVVAPNDANDTSPVVAESVRKPGLYYFDVDPVFLAANGVGEYGGVVEIAAASPKIDDAVSFNFPVTQNDIDSLPQAVIDTVVNCP